jgi:hypothetical protein
MISAEEPAFLSFAPGSVVTDLLGAFVREREAAEILRVNLWQLRKWRTHSPRSRPLPFYRVARRDIRYKVVDLLRFLENSRVEPLQRGGNDGLQREPQH